MRLRIVAGDDEALQATETLDEVSRINHLGWDMLAWKASKRIEKLL